MARSQTVLPLLAAALSITGGVQPDVIVTGSAICSRAPTISYGPVERFDGIMFSFIDGVIFTPCEAGRRCNARLQGSSLDLEWTTAQPVLDRVWNGWGYYRLEFEGRLATRDLSGTCDLGPSEYYEIRRVVSARRLADR